MWGRHNFGFCFGYYWWSVLQNSSIFLAFPHIRYAYFNRSLKQVNSTRCWGPAGQTPPAICCPWIVHAYITHCYLLMRLWFAKKSTKTSFPSASVKCTNAASQQFDKSNFDCIHFPPSSFVSDSFQGTFHLSLMVLVHYWPHTRIPSHVRSKAIKLS